MNSIAGAPDNAARRWVSQRWSARLIRVTVMAAPFLVSLAVSWWIRSLMATPSNWTESILALSMLAIVGITVAIAVERVVRRALPLASLLELSLVFPDRAPSRYGVALRAGSTRELNRQVEHVRTNNLSSDDAEAAEQVLELVEALRHHEPRTRGHTDRVRAFSELIAEEMALTPAQRSRLQWAVLLHDIGKLAVPAELLNKRGAPTDEEWAVIRTHPVIGAEMVEPLAAWLGDWRHSAGQHHERWDGSGYPNGLAGEEISLAGRIVAVADAYDVITSARSYKSPISADLARKELVRCSGTDFDPAVVRAMLRVSVGNVATIAGRFGWLTLLPSLLRPAAAATAGTVAVTAAIVAGATTALPVTAGADIPPVVGFVEDQPPTTLLGVPDPTTTPRPDTAPTPTPAPASADQPAVSDPAPSTSTDETSDTTTTSADTSSTTEWPTTSATAETSATGDTSTTSTPTSTTSTTPTTGPPTNCELALSGEGNLVGADLAACDLSGRSLSNVDLSGADLSGADLSDTNLSNFSLNDANLNGADLQGSQLVDGSMIGANLTNASMQGLSILRVDVASVRAAGVDFAGASFTDVSFGFATLSGAGFTDATFTATNFNDANLGGADFTRANLRGTEFWRTIMTTVTLAASDVDGAVFGATDLTGATGLPVNHATATFHDAICPDSSVRTTTCW